MNAARRHIPPLGAWIGVVLFLGLSIALAVALLKGPGARDPMVGQIAPDISAPLLAGSLPDGGYVVNFWATWCPPCIVEHPVLMDMADQGVPIIGVAYRDDEAKMARYLSSAGNPYSALYFDALGDSLPDWGVRGVPETFVIGADGRVQQRIRGELTEPVFPE